MSYTQLSRRKINSLIRIMKLYNTDWRNCEFERIVCSQIHWNSGNRHIWTKKKWICSTAELLGWDWNKRFVRCDAISWNMLTESNICPKYLSQCVQWIRTSISKERKDNNGADGISLHINSVYHVHTMDYINFYLLKNPRRLAEIPNLCLNLIPEFVRLAHARVVCLRCVWMCERERISYVLNWFFLLFFLFFASIFLSRCSVSMQTHTHTHMHPVSHSRDDYQSIFSPLALGQFHQHIYTRPVLISVAVVMTMRQHHVHIYIIFVLLYGSERARARRSLIFHARKKFRFGFLQSPVTSRVLANRQPRSIDRAGILVTVFSDRATDNHLSGTRTNRLRCVCANVRWVFRCFFPSVVSVGLAWRWPRATWALLGFNLFNEMTTSYRLWFLYIFKRVLLNDIGVFLRWFILAIQ